MSTNGYEIRLSLLGMAKELLEQEWHAHRDVMMRDYDTRVIREEYTTPAIPTLKPFPTETEIIAKAKALNEFINQRA
jgi:hypothetical protein